MKKLVILLMVFALAPLALAEPPQNKRGGMLESLDLTEEQRAKIAEIRADGGSGKEIQAVLTPQQHEQAQEWRKQHGKGGQNRLNHLKEKLDLSEEQALQVKEIFASGGSGKEIGAVLTDEQRKKFQAMAKERKGKGKGKKQGHKRITAQSEETSDEPAAEQAEE